jgi:bifunctional non-homologous end joining protein LigD
VPDPPFDDDGLPRAAHWVKPELVGQFGFTEWTRDGKLRHPRFLGLREDKPAREVVRERPS